MNSVNRVQALVIAVAWAVWLSGCTPSVTPSSSDPRTASPSTTPATASSTRAPIPDLVGVTVIEREADFVAGYDRSCSPGHGCVFGPAWSDDVDVRLGHNGCDTRNDILRESMSDVVFRDGTHHCVVIAGTLVDPYTDDLITFVKADAGAVQIDHVFPLAIAWRRGAATWNIDRRRDFANDPDNLIATAAAVNLAKSDKTPAQWLPASASGRCLYVTRFITIARTYGLPITRADYDTISGVLAHC